MNLLLHSIDCRLLIRRQHLQQQAALLALIGKRLQQPQLQRVVVRVVMLLADQYLRRASQPGDELLRGQGLRC